MIISLIAYWSVKIVFRHYRVTLATVDDSFSSLECVTLLLNPSSVRCEITDTREYLRYLAKDVLKYHNGLYFDELLKEERINTSEKKLVKSVCRASISNYFSKKWRYLQICHVHFLLSKEKFEKNWRLSIPSDHFKQAHRRHL